ncbi:DNA-binding CsgD family transcriptional regulator [Actinoplanes tereljensis]|uniref:LuxR family transcriptional regulator n=1 Tax=Paractinoplanes tereljensis TaxID=571912 RepID=A0A919NQ62_9ACTN|nr:LuxR family transcriptional regulator [Actinoplanes tereljensis]GIF23034.1 LuxR family transcriptional regulator [Actinoplanes tereljensis]
MARVTLRGRAQEMSVLLGSLRQTARSRRGSVIALIGEPGIGKTSVLSDAAEQARRQGFAVGAGKTEEIDQVAAGAPLLVALRSGPQPLLEAESFAGLAPLYERPLWLIDRIAELLAERAARQPVLIGLDDVQWTDPLTRFALRVLPARLADSPVVWLLASRLTPLDRLEDVLAAAGPMPVSRIVLGPITDAEIDELAADRLGTAPDAATRQLLRGVGGNPFWAAQLLTGLARRRAHGLAETDAHAELIAGLRQRLTGLPESVVSVVRAVAVCGRAVPVADVAGLLGQVTAELVYEAATRAQDEGLLTVAETGLSLPHDLIREAIYAHTPAPDRTRLHRARGRQLATAGEAALPAVPHFLASAEPGDLEAAEVALRAAAESVTVMPEQAATLARQAFTMIGVAHPRALEIGERALAVLVSAQRNNDVLDLADTLLPIAGTPGAVARIEVSAGRALWDSGAGPALEHRTNAALGRPDLPPADRARLRALRALAMTRTPSAPAAAEAATRTLAEGARLGDGPAQQTALLALTEITRNTGEHRKVLDYFDQLRLISSSAHVAERIRALQHLDRYDEAATLLAKLRADAGDNLDRLLPSHLFAQVWQHHNLGELAAAEVTARKLLRQAEAIENFAYLMNARMVLGGLAIYRGEVARARKEIAPIENAVERQDTIRASRLLAMQAWLAAEEGDPERSLRIIVPLLSAADDGSHAWAWSPPWMRTFSGIAQQAGDPAAARLAAHLADLGARRNPGVATMKGVALQVRGHQTADAKVLSRAVTVLRHSPRPLVLAGALRDLGDVLVAAGRPEDGQAALREAHNLFEQAGAYGYTRAIEADHPALAAHPRRRAAHGWAALTETEARVAELVAAGHSNRSTAATLGVSTNTVSTHLRSIFTKFEVRSRVQLANAVRDAAPLR